MKKIYLTLATLAVIALASCTNDEIADTSPVNNPEQETPIVFGSLSKGFTRADYTKADAAAKLNYKFVVSAKKGSTTASTSSNITFNNYLVEYTENTAHTTESNVANWEYVGKPRTQHAINAGITSQTIKYWDYSAPQYDFIAWSTGTKTAIYSGTPTSGQVLVSSVNPNATSTGAYTFTGKAEDLSECYISDLMTVKKDQYGSDPVTMTFRQLGIKVRIGFYETVPGYSVKNVKFYTTGGLLTKTEGVLDAGQIVSNATIFSAGADIYKEGTYTITFPTVDTPTSEDNNQAHVTFSPKVGVAQTTTVDFGTVNYTSREQGEKTFGNAYLGRTSKTASFAGNAAKNYYTIYLPNETGANLNLRVDFTLESIDGGGEIIEVKNAKAQVPSIYTQWKPGFAYTYLFKISDKTNGRTGVYDPTQSDDATVNSDPAGLYPITFDAVVVNAEDNEQTQETITTVMTPSITTYQKKSTVVNANEYKANGNDIFVTVNEDNDLVTLTGKAALYRIPSDKTEADVIDALQIEDDYPAAGTIKGRNGLVLTAATQVSSASDIDAANEYALTNSVEFGADGNAISVSTDQSLRFKPASNTTYAFVYTKQNSTETTDKYEVVTKAAGDDVTKLYRNFNLTEVTGDAKSGWTYMSKNSSGVLTTETAFIGQGVTNVYTRSGEEGSYTYTHATGYAATGTTYYYTLDAGSTYIAAHNVNYADFGSSLFVEATPGSGTYISNPDTAPQDGTAYYYYDTDNNKYIYCVILPQQVNGWYRYQYTPNDKYACMSGEKALAGHGYYDKYTMNNGEYYTKIIKVQ